MSSVGVDPAYTQQISADLEIKLVTSHAQESMHYLS